MIIWAICQVYSEIWPIREHCQKYQTGLKWRLCVFASPQSILTAGQTTGYYSSIISISVQNVHMSVHPAFCNNSFHQLADCYQIWYKLDVTVFYTESLKTSLLDISRSLYQNIHHLRCENYSKKKNNFQMPSFILFHDCSEKLIWSSETQREPLLQIWMRSNQQFIRYRIHKHFGWAFWKMAIYGPKPKKSMRRFFQAHRSYRLTF